MTATFDMNTRFEDIMRAILNKKSEDIFVATFITGERVIFDSQTSDNIIIKVVESKVNALKDEMSKMMKAIDETAATEEDDEERYEAMYQAWAAEEEYRYDAEDATLHHCFA